MPTVTVWDFGKLVDATPPELYRELAATHSELATLHEEIAFNRVSELTNPSLKATRITDEGHRDALIEKKFLIIRLLDARSATVR
jgi:hypothetical protein